MTKIKIGGWSPPPRTSTAYHSIKGWNFRNNFVLWYKIRSSQECIYTIPLLKEMCLRHWGFFHLHISVPMFFFTRAWAHARTHTHARASKGTQNWPWAHQCIKTFRSIDTMQPSYFTNEDNLRMSKALFKVTQLVNGRARTRIQFSML